MQVPLEWIKEVIDIKNIKLEELIERLRHFYEIDLDNCNMTNELWIEELAQAMHDKNYKKNFL